MAVIISGLISFFSGIIVLIILIAGLYTIIKTVIRFMVNTSYNGNNSNDRNDFNRRN